MPCSRLSFIASVVFGLLLHLLVAVIPDGYPFLHQSLLCRALDIDHILKQTIARNVDDALFLHLQ
jgi:hypothetical protein